MIDDFGNVFDAWYGDFDDVSVDWSFEDIFSPWQEHPDLAPAVDDASFWRQQTTPFTCAVVCQQMILRQFGIDVSEAQLVYDATVNGWLTRDGMDPMDAGRLLEYYGVPVHYSFGSDIESLVSELAMGRKVIVAVDSGELWKQDWFFEDWVNPNGADHAVVVTGIDLSDPNQPKVYLNDPGDPNGAGKAYPLDEFLDAWSDSGQYYVATDHAPMGLELGPLGAGFNPQTGMYMDGEFWSQWLKSVVSGFDSEYFKSLLNRVAVAATVAGTTALVTTMMSWDGLDDVARNELFLTV